jgi:hypothetical protein
MSYTAIDPNAKTSVQIAALMACCRVGGISDQLRHAASFARGYGITSSQFGDACAALGYPRQSSMNRYNEAKAEDEAFEAFMAAEES